MLIEESSHGCDSGSRLLFHQPMSGIWNNRPSDVRGNEAHVVRHGRAEVSPMASTGMLSLPLAAYTLLSIASWWNAADCSKVECIAPGRA
jgi:hypothetical protein